MEKLMENDYSAYVGFLEDSIVEQLGEYKLTHRLMNERLKSKNLELIGYISELLSDDCPKEYKQVIKKELGL